MDIYHYIDDYGIYTFREKKFNEVDAVIFSFLSYANYNEIFKENERLSIGKIGRMHLGLYSSNDKNIIAVREATKLLRYIKDSNRYKNCFIFHHEYIGNDEVQFGAISIEYMPNHVFVSFEGTDQLVSGWKENFLLSYQFPTLSHRMAIAYLNRYYTFTRKRIIVGGHSKGGNLALVAGMYANLFVRRKIDFIYSADGPGLLNHEFFSKSYQRVSKKYIHIIPNYSFVGLLLNHSNDVVVHSSNKGILSHNIIYWEVEGSHFKKCCLSPLSLEFDQEIHRWLDTYQLEDKEEFVRSFENILQKAHIKSLVEIKEKNSLIFNLIYESRDMSDKTKQILLDFVKILMKTFENTKKEEFKLFLSNLFEIQ